MEPLTEWQVAVMIQKAIEVYDIKQEKRHAENTKRLEDIMATLTADRAVKKFAMWAVPLVIAALSVAAEIIRLVH